MGRRNFPPEFKRRLVDLARSGRRVSELAHEFDVTASTIRRWMQQTAIDSGDQPGTTTDEKQELARLRRRVTQLEEEREILKKFAAWSAQEGNWTPSKRSGS
jgi:transposase